MLAKAHASFLEWPPEHVAHYLHFDVFDRSVGQFYVRTDGRLKLRRFVVVSVYAPTDCSSPKAKDHFCLTYPDCTEACVLRTLVEVVHLSCFQIRRPEFHIH